MLQKSGQGRATEPDVPVLPCHDGAATAFLNAAQLAIKPL
jgi:hypothetical protein